jgi:YHS domain-containing protein
MKNAALLAIFSIWFGGVGADASTPSHDPVMTKGCKKACAYKGQHKKSAVVGQSIAKVGNLVECPVSGVVFKVRTDSERVFHKGYSYFVCCASCAARFKASPEKFVA